VPYFLDEEGSVHEVTGNITGSKRRNNDA